MKTALPSEVGRFFRFGELAMRNFLEVSALLILFLFGEEILAAVAGACPPIVIFLIALVCIFNGNCFEAVGGGCLFLVGIVAMVAWLLIWRFG